MSTMMPMTPKPLSPDFPLSRCPGFVVAMRAKRIRVSSAARHEWMIVSRWGTSGEYLSMAWTSRPAHLGTAPIGLTPRHTALAVRHERATGATPATFALVGSMPDRITVAGDFVPARGYVQLFGAGTSLRIQSEGQCLKPGIIAPWHVEAVRARWIGEFIEPVVTGADCCEAPDLSLLTARTD